MNAAATSTAVLLAGGNCTRMKGTTTDKVLAPLGGACAFTHSLRAFRDSGVASKYVVAYRDDEQRITIETLIRQELPDSAIVAWSPGGPRRQDSVWNALQALDEKTTHVFIHDCARPLIQPAQLVDLLEIVCADGAVCLARRVTDTIKEAPADHPDLRHMKLLNIPRKRLWAMETPQVFDRKLITDAYRLVFETREDITDDAAAVASFGHPVSLLENRAPNLKLTTPRDFDLIEALLERRA
ncbi:MAG: 2-C-methyl-D-erythritol 4-phosphate cytidylyltransferase [Verrucomicrobia bacterium]|nr:MAG: 2-C-methyl-D-erythritol 4-phosphate cytidylyltransferase [Verrucomicrobiota bacterium]